MVNLGGCVFQLIGMQNKLLNPNECLIHCCMNTMSIGTSFTFPPLSQSIASLENPWRTLMGVSWGQISPPAALIDWAACLSLTHTLSVSEYPLWGQGIKPPKPIFH